MTLLEGPIQLSKRFSIGEIVGIIIALHEYFVFHFILGVDLFCVE